MDHYHANCYITAFTNCYTSLKLRTKLTFTIHERDQQS